MRNTERNRRCDPEYAPRVCLQRTGVAFDLIDLLEDPSVTLVDDGADLSEAEAASVAVEQTGAERLLECQDMLADPRSRQPQFARGHGEAVVANDLDEDRHACEAIHEAS